MPTTRKFFSTTYDSISEHWHIIETRLDGDNLALTYIVASTHFESDAMDVVKALNAHR